MLWMKMSAEGGTCCESTRHSSSGMDIADKVTPGLLRSQLHKHRIVTKQ
jgi:hypothetical protein